MAILTSLVTKKVETGNYFRFIIDDSKVAKITKLSGFSEEIPECIEDCVEKMSKALNLNQVDRPLLHKEIRKSLKNIAENNHLIELIETDRITHGSNYKEDEMSRYCMRKIDHTDENAIEKELTNIKAIWSLDPTNTAINTLFEVFRDTIKLYTEIVRSNVLLLEADFTNRKWKKFYNEIRDIHPWLNILLITSYEYYKANRGAFNTEFLIFEAHNFKNRNYQSGFGFISENANSKMVISAIETVKTGKLYRYCYNLEPRPALPDEMNQMSDVAFQEKIEKLNNLSDLQKIVELAHWIDGYKKDKYKKIIKLSAEEIKHSSSRMITDFMDVLIIKGHNNDEIAEILNVDIDLVRTFRLRFVHKINDHSSSKFATNKSGKIIELTKIERTLIRLLSDCFTSAEIAKKLKKSKGTVETQIKALREKFTDDAANYYAEKMTPVLTHAWQIALLPQKENLEIGVLKCNHFENMLINTVTGLSPKEKNALKTKFINNFIESLIFEGYDNWYIASILDKVNSDYVGQKRARLIYRLSNAKSFNLGTKRQVKITPNNNRKNPNDDMILREFLRKSAADESESDISQELNINIHDYRRNLIEKYKDTHIICPDGTLYMLIIRNGEIQKTIEIFPYEINYLKELAAGHTQEEIVKKFDLHIETFRKRLSALKEKLTDDSALLERKKQLVLTNVNKISKNLNMDKDTHEKFLSKVKKIQADSPNKCVQKDKLIEIAATFAEALDIDKDTFQKHLSKLKKTLSDNSFIRKNQMTQRASELGLIKIDESQMKEARKRPIKRESKIKKESKKKKQQEHENQKSKI